MSDTIFFRLLDGVNRPARLSEAIEDLREGGETADSHSASPGSLRQVPGSPFAYWVSNEVRSKFAKLSPFANDKRTVKQGLATADDFRFLRTQWEVKPQSVAWNAEGTARGSGWVAFAKGGEYSPYYSDIHLLVNWERNGEEIKGNRDPKGRVRSNVWMLRETESSYFFRPGLTWPRRTQRGLSVRVFPQGCIFADKGPAIFSNLDSFAWLLAIVNSKSFHSLVALQMAFGSYEVGVIQRTPIPDVSEAQAEVLSDLAFRCVGVKRGFDTANEPSHVFHLPALLQAEGATLEDRLERWQALVSDGELQLTEYQRKIDDIAYQLYGIEGEDRRAIEESLSGGDGTANSDEEEGAAETEDSEEATAIRDSRTLVSDLLSYAVGCVFGRWDARIALDSSLAPDLADPFAPLPVCSPGTLVGPDSLPAGRDGIASEEWMRARPDAITPPLEDSVGNPTIPDSEYPLAVDWDGILVDDPDHPDDVVRRVRDVLDLLWGGRADEIEHEACGLLGIKDLRSYFRNPRKFWDFHVKRYSKSRRKAPIYWLLQPPKKNFGLWIYYHRLDPDILFKALTKYVEPKIRLEESRLDEYEAQRREAGTGGSEAKKAEKAVQDQETLLTDLREFRDRLQRAAGLYLRPDLNDGVVLNIAPLHELVPWKETKSKWDDLLSGKHEWSSIGKQLHEKGLV